MLHNHHIPDDILGRLILSSLQDPLPEDEELEAEWQRDDD